MSLDLILRQGRLTGSDPALVDIGVSAGRIVGIFPEGPSSREGRLVGGHPGVALIALRSGVPVVPGLVDPLEDAAAARAAAEKVGYPIALKAAAGGGGISKPTIRSMIHLPRSTGEVVVPFAVTFSTLAWVIRPPRTLCAGSATRRMATPSTPGIW